MKILQIIDGRCCDAIRAFVIEQCKTLVKLGDEIIILDTQGKVDFGLIELNDNERALVATISSMIQFPVNISRFARLAAKLSPDIIVVHGGESHFVAAFGILISRRKIPLVRFRWDNRPRQGISIPAKFVSRRLTSGIAVPTRRAADYVAAKLTPKKLEIFYQAIDSNYFMPVPRSKRFSDKYKINPENVVVGICGRLDPQRGHRSFIEAAKLISIKYPIVRFLISGFEGSVKFEHLKVLTDKLRISDRFIFIDRVEDIRKVYSLCDIGVIATIGYEPISRIPLEFMAMGKPIIGTNLNQTNDILANCGILIPPGDPVALAAALGELIENADLRAEIGQKSLTAVADYYTMNQLGDRSRAFFREIIGGKN